VHENELQQAEEEEAAATAEKYATQMHSSMR